MKLSGCMLFVRHNEKIEKTKDAKDKRNPPPESNINSIFSNPGEPVSLSQFRVYLSKIGYSIYNRGCNHYGILNHSKQYTNLGIHVTESEKIELDVVHKELLFGAGFCGCFVANLEDAKIELNSRSLYLQWGNFTICLYNFDDPYTPYEKYLTTLPQVYQAKAICTKCKAVQNKSYLKSALYIYKNSLTISFLSPFSSPPRCPKCKHSSFGDMNIAVDIVYFRRGKRVGWNQIKTEAEKQLEEWKKKEIDAK